MQLSATSAALSLLLAASATAQTHPFADPANLRGERINPHTGRELPIDEGARGLQESLRRLSTRASLMLIVAHPDDEDGGMLTLYSRGLGARVATLTLTRGEGGQNAMTGDFEDALGLIRTQELLSADRYLGVDQMFGTEVDFGFSKTKEEAFAKWTHERVLYDAVRAVRLYRPLVIAAVFSGAVTDGHGQHQVSGEIAQEVFNAAGDPKIFPELTAEGILPWKPLKVYARVPSQSITPGGLFDYATGQYAPARFTNYVTGQVTTTAPSEDVEVHEGVTDPLLSEPGEPARSYVQFARLGLGLQKTQIGPGVRMATPGAYDVGYHRYGSRLSAGRQGATETSFFDGIDTGLTGIASLSSEPPSALRQGLARLRTELTAITKEFQASHPDAVAPKLAEAQQGLGAMIYALDETSFPGKADVMHELRAKQVQLNEALTQALGLRLRATVAAKSADLPLGCTPEVETVLESASAEPTGVFAVGLEDAVGKRVERVVAEDREPVVTAWKPFTQKLSATAELTSVQTRPYFDRTGIEQPVYRLRDPALRNAPGAPPALTAWATLRYRNIEVSLGRVVDAGEQALAFVPPVSVRLSQHAQVVPRGETSLQLSAQVAMTSPVEGRLSLSLPSGWHAEPDAPPLSPVTNFHVDVPQTSKAAVLSAKAEVDGRTYTEGFYAVGYPGIPRTDFYSPATDHVVPVDLRLPARRRIAYVPGTGDSLPEALASVGLPVVPLTVADLTSANLARFDTVILGVRTYNAHPDLHGGPTQSLLDWVRAGGNLVVQYQTSEFTGADAPYPLALGGAEKVVDETAPVKLTLASASLLSVPNRLTGADFDGWVEERGHGFLGSWDSAYSALTEVHDAGQTPQRGGLITAAVGRGHWTYCAFALYRQLPEAVPGAFRILANLLALGDGSKQ